MIRQLEHYGKDPFTVRRTTPATWKKPYTWHRKVVKGWERDQVFTCSMSDFFHKDADVWRADAWQVIRKTPALQYQILTKRPGRMLHCLPPDWGDGYSNVCLGVSIENQDWLWRLDTLRTIPARIRFLSLEPLLGDLGTLDLSGIHWVIIGGESGSGYRPMEIDWMISLYEQCRAAGVPVHIKQDAAGVSGKQGRIPDWLWQVKEFPRGIQSPRRKESA
jgi:protein gp37